MLAKLILLSLSLLSSTAVWAQDAARPAPPSTLSMGLFWGGFIAIIYFLFWRPQSKRAKEHRNLLSNLKTGDEVITSSGMLGSIKKVTEQFVVLSLSGDVEITLQKHAITQALPKGTIKSI